MEFTAENNGASFETYNVELPNGGYASLAVTSSDHIHFDANCNCLGTTNRHYMVARGIEYGVSIHFRRIDGNWTVEGSVHVTKIPTLKYPTQSVKNGLCNVALFVVNEFTSQHPEVFAIAHKKNVAALLERRTVELIEATKQLQEIKSAIVHLKGQLAGESIIVDDIEIAECLSDNFETIPGNKILVTL